jgi:hypothetical protein
MGTHAARTSSFGVASRQAVFPINKHILQAVTSTIRYEPALRISTQFSRSLQRDPTTRGRRFQKQKTVAHLTGALFRQVRRNRCGHSISIPVL